VTALKTIIIFVEPADEGSEEADGTKSSENDTEKAGEEDYEYEYEDES